MPVRYEIRVEGLIAQGWSAWLGGMAITHLESGDTLISGMVSDQTALHGLLAKIRDMNLTLISVTKDTHYRN